VRTNPEVARADVWVVDPRAMSPTVAAQCVELLSTAERQQMRGFHFEPDRRAYLAAHALTRLALSTRDPGVPPNAWLFTRPPQGRPELVIPPGSLRWRFNLTHTRKQVAVIVTCGPDCGVDVESVPPAFDGWEENAGVLSASDRAQLLAVPQEGRSERFHRLWTLKEAYAKAPGLGLQLPFHHISFELGNGCPRLIPHSEEWHFEQWLPDPDHVLATAIRAPGPITVHRHVGMPEIGTGLE